MQKREVQVGNATPLRNFCLVITRHYHMVFEFPQHYAPVYEYMATENVVPRSLNNYSSFYSLQKESIQFSTHNKKGEIKTSPRTILEYMVY